MHTSQEVVCMYHLVRKLNVHGGKTKQINEHDIYNCKPLEHPDLIYL